MDQKIKDLWNNNKILFFIALPLIILYFFHSLIFAMIAGSARKVTSEAKVEDEKIKTEITKTDLEAAATKAEADQLDQKIKDRQESDISEDWNKKK